MTTSPEIPDLARRALFGTAQFLVVLGVLIFAPAWSLSYWQGWLLWLHLGAWTLGLTLYFLRHDPALVARRLRAGAGAEQEPAQKRIQLFNTVAILALFLLSVVDHRFAWSHVPAPVVVLGHVLLAAGFVIVFLALKENTFAGATVALAVGQRVIASGPYARVRHPMYSGAALLLAAIPLALGSWWGLLVTVALLVGLVARLQHEEAFLLRHLPEYDVYRRAVRARLVPRVW